MIDLNRIYVGDCLEVMRFWPDAFIQTVVTSPPYWALRDYDMPEQIGHEKSPAGFVEKMVGVFREVRRVLRDDGTLWLNLGDSYCAAATGSVQDRSIGLGGGRRTQKEASRRPDKFATGIKPKDLVGIPWRVALALQADGWYLRSDIIWHKPNPMPESVTDRPTKSHEYIFLMAKSEQYFYDHEAIKERATLRDDIRPFGNAGGNRHGDEGRLYNGKWSKTDNQSSGKRLLDNMKKARDNGADHDNPFGADRNKRSVWTVPTSPYSGAHFATFPSDLIKPCILAGSRPKDVVFDPFMGAGTTALVALQFNRQFIGTELNPEYATMAEKRFSTEKSQLKFV